jgi:serine protease Do
MSAALVLAALAAAAGAAAPEAAPRGGVWTDAPAGPRPAGPPAIPALLKAAMPAVVAIVATTARAPSSADPFHEFLEKTYGPTEGREPTPVRGIGTGFLIRKDGLIVTNNHVIEGATDVAVQVGPEASGERVYRGVVVGKDEATDLALLHIEGGPFPVLPLGDSDAVEVGEWVVAIGNPFGLARSVTTGIVSYKGRRDVNPTGKPGYYDFVQTDAAINPGNSGGPLIDARGAVIAINAAVNPTGQGIGFAVPINMFKELARQLESRGRVVRGWMGLSIQEQLSPELAESFGVPGRRGVLITEVTAGGPAARAGLRSGDVVTAFDGEPVSEAWRLRWLTSIAQPGRSVKLAVLREGKPLAVEVALQDKPGENPGPAAPAEVGPREVGSFGIVAEDRAADESQPTPRGVRIGSVDVRGSGFRAGLREGDLVLEVDGHPVDDRAVFEKQAAAGSGIARLLVRRGQRVMYFGLRHDPPPQPRPQEETARAH